MIKEALRFRANASFTGVFLVFVLVAGYSFLNSKINCWFLFQPKIKRIWACPCGSGFPLQVLVRTSLRAFRCNPSRKTLPAPSTPIFKA